MDPEDDEIELQNGVEIEGQEQDIVMQNELIAVGKVNSVNGKTGDVILTTSDLENDSDYQTGSEVESAISEAVAGKQDKLTAGNNITIENNVISSSDTTYTAGNGLNLSNENEFSVDTTVVATQANLSAEVKNREDADTALQGQIDAISASSDVVDIVGTYAELQAYDTQHLKDNDIIKVLQDETQNNATTYYRWSTHTNTFTLIGQEGPYYTKASADAQFVPQTRTVNSKALSSNITLTASDVSAVATGDVVQATGSNTAKVMSQKATTDALGLKLNISDYVVDTALADSTNPVQNKVLYGLFSSMPSDFFTGPVSVNGNGRDITLNGTMNAKLSDVKMYGDTTQASYSGKNLFQAPSTAYDTIRATYTKITDNSFTIATTETANWCRAAFSITGLQQNTNYTISGVYTNTGSITNNYLVVLTTGGTSIKEAYVNSTTSLTFNTGANTDVIIRIFASVGAAIDNTLTVTNFQLESGSATTYEPYVGGTASPNPDYPQDVNVVTGTQTVGVSGKNLIYSAESHNSINSSGTILSGDQYLGVTNYVPCKPNTDYAVSFQHETSDLNLYVGFKDKDGNFIIRNGYGTLRTFTTPDGATSMFFYMTKTGATPSIGGYAMLEYGSTVSQFEPYQGASYTVRLGSLELCKIGTYQDYIYKSGDDWYVHKEIQKHILTAVDGEQNSAFIWYASPSALTTTSVGTIIVACDMYLAQGTNYRDSIGNFRIAKVYGNNQQIGLKDNRFANYTEFNTWVVNNNATLYYVLATPTDTKITNADLISDLNALWNALSYDGQTNIAITASGLSGILDVTAYKKTLAGMIAYINR